MGQENDNDIAFRRRHFHWKAFKEYTYRCPVEGCCSAPTVLLCGHHTCNIDKQIFFNAKLRMSSQVSGQYHTHKKIMSMQRREHAQAKRSCPFGGKSETKLTAAFRNLILVYRTFMEHSNTTGKCLSRFKFFRERLQMTWHNYSREGDAIIPAIV